MDRHMVIPKDAQNVDNATPSSTTSCAEVAAANAKAVTFASPNAARSAALTTNS